MSSEVRSGLGERRGLSPVHRPACTWQARAESAKPCYPLASGLPVEALTSPSWSINSDSNGTRRRAPASRCREAASLGQEAHVAQAKTRPFLSSLFGS